MGYIKIDRRIQEHWIWKAEPFTKAQAWIDLILLAQYKDGTYMVRGKLINRKRGEVHFSQLSLAERWGWSRGKVSRFLKQLENEKMVTVNSTVNDTTITIENYDVYQLHEAQDKTVDRATDGTTDGQLTVQQTVHSQKRKESKEREEGKRIKEINKEKYGELQNVKLTSEEYVKLMNRFSDYEERINKLSFYIASKGDRYKSHYATILNWAKKEEDSKPQKSRYDFIDDIDISQYGG